MKDYNNAFLGIILAGVLMLVIGLSLLIRPSPVVGVNAGATTSERATKSAALSHFQIFGTLSTSGR